MFLCVHHTYYGTVGSHYMERAQDTDRDINHQHSMGQGYKKAYKNCFAIKSFLFDKFHSPRVGVSIMPKHFFFVMYFQVLQHRVLKDFYIWTVCVCVTHFEPCDWSTRFMRVISLGLSSVKPVLQ